MNGNYDLAMRYKDTSMSSDEYRAIQGGINSACRHFILGRACIAEKERLYQSGSKLNTLGKEFGYAKASADKFISYAKAIEHFQSVAPDLARKILEGEIRLSMKDAVLLSRKETSEIIRIGDLLTDKRIKVADIFPRRGGKARKNSKPKLTSIPVKDKTPTIKDMPAFDPDAPVSGLSCTIPSWVGAIEKVFMTVDFNTISVKARYKLRKELVMLADTAGVVIEMIRLKNDG